MAVRQSLDSAVELYNKAWWGRPFVTVIPFVGGSIDALITARASRIQRERFERFAEELRAGFARLDADKVDTAFLESDAFYDFFVATMAVVLRTHEQEKIVALRNAFVRGSTVTGSAGPLKEMVVRLTGDLTSTHMVVLRRIDERERTFNPIDRERNEDYTDLPHLEAYLTTIPSLTIAAVAHDLVHLGLLRNWWIGRFGTGDDRFALSAFGQQFLRYITADAEDNLPLDI